MQEREEKQSASGIFYATIALALGAPLVMALSAHFAKKDSACDPARPDKTVNEAAMKERCEKQPLPSPK